MNQAHISTLEERVLFRVNSFACIKASPRSKLSPRARYINAMSATSRNPVITGSKHVTSSRYKHTAHRPPFACSSFTDEISHPAEIFIFA
jgi:hypothetical protein